MHSGSSLKQSRDEPSVAVAQNQRVLGLADFRKKPEPSPLQFFAESAVFNPPVRPGDRIAVHLSNHRQKNEGSQQSDIRQHPKGVA